MDEQRALRFGTWIAPLLAAFILFLTVRAFSRRLQEKDAEIGYYRAQLENVEEASWVVRAIREEDGCVLCRPCDGQKEYAQCGYPLPRPPDAWGTPAQYRQMMREQALLEYGDPDLDWGYDTDRWSIAPYCDSTPQGYQPQPF